MSFVVKHQPASSALALLPTGFGAANQFAAPAGETMTIDFRGVFNALARRKWWMLIPTLVAMAGGLAAALLATPKYTASVQILVDPREIQLVRPDASLRAQVPDATGSLAENAIVMLRSSGLLMRVIDRENLTEDAEFVGKTLEGSIESRRLRALMALDKRVGARRADRSSVVEATVASSDQVKAARLANALAAAFLDQQSGAESETARKASQTVASRLDELSARVQKTDREVEEYKAKNNLQTANGKLVGEQQLQELNSQLVLARTRTSEARSKYESVRKLSVQAIERGELPDTANSSVISQLRLKFAEASRLEADARTKLGARHPEMVAIMAQVRDMRALITDELSRISRTAQGEYDRARVSEESLTRSLEQLKSQSSDLSGASVRLRELERQADASREIYNSFLKRARELNEQEGISTFNARIISPATPPQYASGVGRSMILIGSTIAGIMLGLILALLAEQFDQTLRNRAQFQSISGLPVLGEMPAGRRSAGITAHVVEQPHGAFAAGACRVADVFAAQTAPQRARSVLLLSVSDRVNLTEVALNVSIAAAQATWRVLMIDADASGNGLSRHLDLLPNYGLADVIDRRCPISSAILTDDRTDVRILPATGARQGQPASRRLSPQLIQQQVLAAAQGFELIFIDGGIAGADAASLAFAGAVDDVVLVAASGQTTKKDMQDAMDQLEFVRSRLRGVVTV